MSNINTTQTVYLYTAISGGIQPYDQCARWNGSYTASNGTTGSIVVDTSALTNVPFIDSNNTPCSIPGTDGGSLTGTLIPNGFTGTLSVWVDVADSSGIYKESNTKTYSVVPLTALLVNAGPDQSISGAGPTLITFNGAAVSGGTPPYTYAWSQDIFTNPDITYFSNSADLQPTATGFNNDGTYVFELSATDSTPGTPLTGTDTITVTVTGATPPPPPIPSAALSWSVTFDGVDILGGFQIDRRRGGVTSNLVSTNVSTNGTIPASTLGLVTGDEVRISVSAADGSFSSFGDTFASATLARTLRTPPNTASIIQSVFDNDTGGFPSSVLTAWYIVNPTGYWYDVVANGSVY
jgi:hypothetical protein